MTPKPLLCLSERYPPHRGGAFVWMHALNRRLGQVRVVTGKMPGTSRREVLDGVPVHRVRLERYPFLRPESLALYGNFVVQGMWECMLHGPSAIVAARVLPEGLVANVIARATDLPTVIFAHGEEIAVFGRPRPAIRRRRLTTAFKRNLLWRVYHGASAIIANSRHTAELLARGGVSPEKITVVHPGTDPDTYRPMPADEELIEQLGLAGKKVLLTVGRLTRRKGQDMVLRALHLIRQKVPEAVYLIAGAGPAEGALRVLARLLGLDEVVRFLGRVETALLPKLYNAADVFLMPNRDLVESGDVEGFGIVFLEAGACEVPVIGGRSGGVPEAVIDGRTGLLVDGDSPAEIAEAAVRILTDGDLARGLGRAARRRVRAELTWDRSAEAVRTAMRALTGGEGDVLPPGRSRNSGAS